MAAFTPVGVEAQVRGLGSFLRDMGKMDSSIQDTADRSERSGSRIGALSSKFASLGRLAAKAALTGIVAVGAAVATVGVISLKTAIDFESAFAGVVKTTDGLVDEFGDLTDAGQEISDGFRDMAKEVPLAVEELLEIGELGGQLGVARDDLLDFTEVIAAMGVSTNLSTEAAGTGLARLANVMGTTESQGSAAFSRLGSTIVALGNTSATTEADILSFAQRMAGAAAVAGVTEADMLGISAAFSSVGIQAQAGGTAVSKVFLNMNKAALEGGEAMEIFANVAGLEAEAFGAAWEKDAGAVFGEFVTGLGLAGDDAVAILDALEIKDSQAVRAFLSLAGAGDLVTESMITANEGWEENTALAKEAETRYATTAAQFVLVKNSIKDMAITGGQVLLPFLKRGIDAVKPFIDEFGKRLPDILNNTLVPALEKVAEVIEGVIAVIIGLAQGTVGIDTPFEDFFPPGIDKIAQDVVRAIVPALEIITKVTKTFVDFIKANGPQIIKVLKSIGKGIALAFAVQKVLGPIKLIIAAIGLITSPIGLVAIAIAVLAKAWASNWGDIQGKVQAVMDELRPTFEAIQEWFIALLPQALQFLSDLWTNTLLPAIQAVSEFVQTILIPAFMQFVEFLTSVLTVVIQEVTTFMIENFAIVKAWVDENWPLIQETIQTVMDAIQLVIETVLTAIQTFWTEHGETILAVITEVWGIIKAVIQTTIETVLAIIKAVMQAINGDWATAWETIKGAAAGVWEGIKELVSAAINFIKDTIIPTAMSAIETAWGIAWETIKTAVDTIWEGIKTLVGTAIEAAKTKIIEILDALGIEWEDNWKDIQTALEIVWTAIQDAIETALGIIQPAIETALGIIETVFSTTMDAIQIAVETAWAAIETAFDVGIKAAKAVLDAILPAMTAAGGAIVDAIQDGISAAWDGLIDWFNSKLDDLTDWLPGSEPKVGSRSALFGLDERGKAIVKNIQAGIAAAMPELQATLNAAVAPTQGPGVTTIGGNVTNTTQINQIEVNPTLASQPSDQAIFMDVSAALAAGRT